MKAQKIMLKTMAGMALAGAFFIGCNKNETASLPSAQMNDQRIMAFDEARVSSVSDEIIAAANSVVTNSKLPGFMNLQHLLAGTYLPCNATIDNSAKDKGMWKIIFKGPNCEGTRMRTGVITLQLPYNPLTNVVTSWNVSGSTLAITYNNFRVTDIGATDGVNVNHLLIFSGSKKIMNESGGVPGDPLNIKEPLVQRVTGAEQITFEDGTMRKWNID